MSSPTITNDNMPLYLGMGVVTIILIAFFSKEEESQSKRKKESVATHNTPATTSKKSKKKKKRTAVTSVASAERKAVSEKAPVAQEPKPEPAALKDSRKKKKKKSKKKATTTASATGEESKKVAGSADNDDDSDDEFDLFAIQSAREQKGAIDAAKRAAANKERDRIRAIKRQEEKAKAAAQAAAVAQAAVAAEAETKALALKEKENAAKQASLASEATAVEEQKKKATAKNNGASVFDNINEDSAPATTGGGDKKKRKRKKKKHAANAYEESSRPVLVKPAPSGTQWETVPPVIAEWQEVEHKKSKQQAKMAAAAVKEEGATGTIFHLAVDSVVEEPGDTSVRISAGDNPLIFIGKGGATIQNLEETTGAKFDIDRLTNVLTITGPEDCVQDGLAEAQAILAMEAERKANEAEERVTWGPGAIKAVIGRGGANIRATQEATGVRIDADVDAGTLVIVGPADQVSTALTMCHNAAFGEVQDVMELGSRNAVNLVYGPSFQTIQSLQDSTGCKLDITRGSTTLKLAGSSEAVAEASAQIRALLEANRGFEMTIENSKVGAVYGKGGETLRSIQDRTGTQIDVSRGPTHATVSVMGTTDASTRARNMLQRAIDGEVELQPGEVAEDVELGSATAAIIGRGGSNVAELEKRHGVKINVRSEFQKARVVGKPDKVAGAVKAIMATAQPILDAEEAQRKADEEQENGKSAWQVDAGFDDADGW